VCKLHLFPQFATLTTSAKPGIPATKSHFVALKEAPGTIFHRRGSDRLRQHQAMISAVIVIALLSLLVATEPEPAGSSAHPSPEPPLRPARRKPTEQPAEPDRLAA
jgi:hypothetical protein